MANNNFFEEDPRDNHEERLYRFVEEIVRKRFEAFARETREDQRDILFMLRTLRASLANNRVEISPHTQEIHCAVIGMDPYHGRCPCCEQTPVLGSAGERLPPAEFDHFWGGVYNAPVHSWLICQTCHQELTNDPHILWYARLTTKFRRYQALVAAHATAFGPRTPAKMHTAKRRL